MRLIGGHDYYDGVVPFDSDQERVFIRDGRSLIPPVEKSKIHLRWRYFPREDIRVPYIQDILPREVIFCGRIYPALMLSVWMPLLLVGSGGRSYIHVWDAKQLQTELERYGAEFLSNEKPRGRGWIPNWLSERNIWRENLEEFFSSREVGSEILEWQIKERALIAISPENVNEKSWTINSSSLGKIGFGRVKHSWEAYQELEMYLGTILVGDEDKMVHLNDKELAVKHGFDKHSFRNTNHPAKPRGKTK